MWCGLNMRNDKLGKDYFNRYCVDVARDLLGQRLIFGPYQGIIIETEAYRGADDPASHSYKGPTPRSAIMFGEPGVSYVYFIYGMYHCLNIVTEDLHNPSAVLIRGIKLITPETKLLNGPGKICRELGITRDHSGFDLTQHNDFYIAQGEKVEHFEVTPRIGIKVATDKLWRFVVK